MRNLLISSTLVALAACADVSPSQPTTAASPTEPSEDACNMHAFEGSFDVARPTHLGDTPFCANEAEAWNESDDARVMRFWRNVDGSWTSELTATPQAGQTAYTLDAPTCTLENDASTTIGARDLENNSVRVPLRTVTTVSLTNDGVRIDVKETLDGVSHVAGLPCAITSSTKGSRL